MLSMWTPKFIFWFSFFFLHFFCHAKKKLTIAFQVTIIIFIRYPFFLPYRVVCPIYLGVVFIPVYIYIYIYYLPQILWNFTISTGKWNKKKKVGLDPCTFVTRNLCKLLIKKNAIKLKSNIHSLHANILHCGWNCWRHEKCNAISISQKLNSTLRHL